LYLFFACINKKFFLLHSKLERTLFYIPSCINTFISEELAKKIDLYFKPNKDKKIPALFVYNLCIINHFLFYAKKFLNLHYQLYLICISEVFFISKSPNFMTTRSKL